MSLPENSINTEEVKHDLGIDREQREDNKISRKAFNRRRYPGNNTTRQDGYSTSSSRPASEKKSVCRFYLQNWSCRYGSNCRYSHATAGVETAHVDSKEQETQGQKDSPGSRYKTEICHFFERFGHCRYGRSCRYIHSYKKAAHTARIRGEDGPQTTPDNSSERGPANGTFDTGVKAVSNAKPDVSAVNAGVQEALAEESLEVLRDREIQQFLKRYRNCQKIESNDGIQRYNFVFRPTDPDWRFDVRELTLTVGFPPTYPKDHLSLNVYDEEGVLPSLLVRDLNKAIAKWIQDRHVSNQAANPNQLVMRPFLRWLDRNLEDMFIESLRKIKRIQLAQEAGIEFVPHEQLSSNTKTSPSSSVAEGTANENAATQDLRNETDSGSDDSQSQNSANKEPSDNENNPVLASGVSKTDDALAEDKHKSTLLGQEDNENVGKNCQQNCSNTKNSRLVSESSPAVGTKTSSHGTTADAPAQVEKTIRPPAPNGISQAIVTNPKRGTEIKLRRLEMGENVGTLECRHISIRVQCARCKCSAEVATPTRRRNVIACGRCRKDFSVVFRSNMMHPYNSVIGYLDLTDCFALDLVLPQCVFEAACLGCDKEMRIDGIHVGQQKATWCQSCNSKLTFLLESVKFQNLQPAKTTDANGTFLIKAPRVAKKVRDPAIQEGKPLPDEGACKHYKKSYRWLRFPCCGKAYACDVCHEEHEGDHEMKYATRMICGHCAKEQPYSAEKPCIGCGGFMTKKVTAHWEGGKGCRDRIKMSRDDNKKYSGTGKTISKKAQATKPTGKK